MRVCYILSNFSTVVGLCALEREMLEVLRIVKKTILN